MEKGIHRLMRASLPTALMSSTSARNTIVLPHRRCACTTPSSRMAKVDDPPVKAEIAAGGLVHVHGETVLGTREGDGRQIVQIWYTLF